VFHIFPLIWLRFAPRASLFPSPEYEFSIYSHLLISFLSARLSSRDQTFALYARKEMSFSSLLSLPAGTCPSSAPPLFG